MPEETLNLKRNPDYDDSESYNVRPFWRAKFHIVGNEDSRGFVRTWTWAAAFKVGWPTSKPPCWWLGQPAISPRPNRRWPFPSGPRCNEYAALFFICTADPARYRGASLWNTSQQGGSALFNSHYSQAFSAPLYDSFITNRFFPNRIPMRGRLNGRNWSNAEKLPCLPYLFS